MARSVLTGARVLDEEARKGGFRCNRWFVTLTYAPGKEWAPNDISRFSDRMAQWAYRKGFKIRYVFKAELQQRGAVHYHLVVWTPKGVALPKPDKRGWWTNGHSQREIARAPTKYLSKYTSKGLGDCGATMPRGARCFGLRGLSSSGRGEVRFWNFPSYVREWWGSGAVDARKVEGGFVHGISGEFLRSRYVYLSSFGGSSAFVRRDLQDSVTFSWRPTVATVG